MNYLQTTTMKKYLGILLVTIVSLTSCDNYKEVKSEDLKSIFVLNSSSTFKGYYYEGSDKDYHYFISKWDFEKDRKFKLRADKLTIGNKYRFSFGEKELRIDLLSEDKVEFGQNEFCKLYIVKTMN